MIQFLSAEPAAEKNFNLLLGELEPDWRTVLDSHRVFIHWERRELFLGSCDLLFPVITFNPDYFAAFTHRTSRLGRRQRFVSVGFKEEIVHHLSKKLRFDRSQAWCAAVRSDLAETNLFRDRLSLYQRRYDGEEGFGYRCSLQEYTTESHSQRLFLWLCGRSVFTVEALPTVLQARDYLAQKLKSEAVHSMMHRAYPACYPLFLSFEKKIATEASRLRQFTPSLSSQPGEQF